MSVRYPLLGQWSRVLRLAASCSLAVLMTGCASNSAETPTAEVRTPPQQFATTASGWKVEIEDDGLPAQSPPLLRRNPTPDDPTEPFSPNYGSRPVRADLPAPAPTRAAYGSQDAAPRAAEADYRAYSYDGDYRR